MESTIESVFKTTAPVTYSFTESNPDVVPSKDETISNYTYRLGTLKTEGKIDCTWDDIAEFINRLYKEDHCESYYRRLYKKISTEKIAENMTPEALEDDDLPAVRFFKAVSKERIRLRDERISTARQLREESRRDELFDLFETEIKKAQPIKRASTQAITTDKALYACLSDLHYGISYATAGGVYNSDIAKERVMRYAEELIEIGKVNNCSDLYLSLMGDMISGNIHTTVRIENRENIVEQVVGVSELVSSFINELAAHFNSVFVNAVPGNHSRIDANLDNTLRGERLDNLITFYCKAKLSNIANVHFVENEFDSTVGTFTIFGKTYACVHGDMDPDPKTTAARIGNQLGRRIYCLLLGHLHVATTQFEDTVYIRNGSVCGSGDEFTMKKRLFGPPIQVCSVVSINGIEAVYPVNLQYLISR